MPKSMGSAQQQPSKSVLRTHNVQDMHPPQGPNARAGGAHNCAVCVWHTDKPATARSAMRGGDEDTNQQTHTEEDPANPNKIPFIVVAKSHAI